MMIIPPQRKRRRLNRLVLLIALTLVVMGVVLILSACGSGQDPYNPEELPTQVGTESVVLVVGNGNNIYATCWNGYRVFATGEGGVSAVQVPAGDVCFESEG